MFVCNWIDPDFVVPCHFYCDSGASLATHLKEDHLEDSRDAPFYCYWDKCHYAQEEFESKGNLIRHIHTHLKQRKRRGRKPNYVYDEERYDVGDVCESQLEVSNIVADDDDEEDDDFADNPEVDEKKSRRGRKRRIVASKWRKILPKPSNYRGICMNILDLYFFLYLYRY